MKITIEDNVITAITPSDCEFKITIRTDSLDIEGSKPTSEFGNDKSILNLRTIDPNKVRLSV